MDTKNWRRALPPGERDWLPLLDAYERRFGTGEAALLSSPGRTELSGNHTDHQNGCVLCASVTDDIRAVGGRRTDGKVVIFSQGFGEFRLRVDQLSPLPAERGASVALVRGVLAALGDEGLPAGGFQACVSSRIPAGMGLSSSAAFELLVGGLCCALYQGALPPAARLAPSGRRAENEYYGKPCGLLDQMACACGGVQYIDFRDPAAPAVTALPFDFRSRGWVLGLVSSGASHDDLTADYAAIPRDMSAVAGAFGERALRHVNQADFEAQADALARSLSPRAVLRARHFFEENARVPAMAEALKRGDMEAYRRLMLASGQSSRQLLQNIVPPSHPERTALRDTLDLCAEALDGAGAWRVHGGGFAGAAQCLVPLALWEDFCARMDAALGAGACREVRVRPLGVHLLIAGERR